MVTNGGGYQFMNPADFSRLSSADVASMQTNDQEFLIRMLDSSAQQKYGIISQLAEYE